MIDFYYVRPEIKGSAHNKKLTEGSQAAPEMMLGYQGVMAASRVEGSPDRLGARLEVTRIPVGGRESCRLPTLLVALKL